VRTSAAFLVLCLGLACRSAATEGESPPEPEPDAAVVPDAAVAFDTAAPADTSVDRAPRAPDLPAIEAAPPPADIHPADASGEAVPLFVAQGDLGRTTVSCDDGLTWVANQSSDDAAVCFTGGLDCDHSPGAGRGITWGNGWFVATFGWGPPGAIRRSRDGVTWEPVTTGTTFAGVAFGDDQFLAGGRPAWVGGSDGGGWKKAGDPRSRSGTCGGRRSSAAASWSTATATPC